MNPAVWAMFAAGAVASGSYVWLTTEPLREEVRRRDQEVAALKSRIEGFGLSERELSARSDDVQRLSRSLSALESALKQANTREEVLRRRLVAVTGGRPELIGPPPPEKAPVAATPPKLRSSSPPSILAEVRDRIDGRPSGSSSNSDLRLLSPVVTYLREDRPTFAWRPVQDAVSYDLVIYTAQRQEVAREIGIREPGRTLASALARGKVYRWEVIAYAGGREIARAPGPNEPAPLFGIFSGDQLRTAAKIETESRLSRAAGLAKAGLLDEAEAEIEAISRAAGSPDIHRRALALRSQIRAWKE